MFHDILLHVFPEQGAISQQPQSDQQSFILL